MFVINKKNALLLPFRLEKVLTQSHPISATNYGKNKRI